MKLEEESAGAVIPALMATCMGWSCLLERMGHPSDGSLARKEFAEERGAPNPEMFAVAPSNKDGPGNQKECSYSERRTTGGSRQATR
jgi:hypothetical protein